MPRVKRGVTAGARHKKVLALAKGFQVVAGALFGFLVRVVLGRGGRGQEGDQGDDRDERFGAECHRRFSLGSVTRCGLAPVEPAASLAVAGSGHHRCSEPPGTAAVRQLKPEKDCRT